MSKSESTKKDFPDWENLYKSQSVETMPWYNERFDSDLERELDQRKIIVTTSFESGEPRLLLVAAEKELCAMYYEQYRFVYWFWLTS